MKASHSSWFSRISAGAPGIDPYTTAASDVYQDLFGEGTFTGKGLYDVDAFTRALAERVPENALLSHDLFEGLYARAALVTDVEFLDDYPARYVTYAMRQHRWTRGDWQLLPFIFARGNGLNLLGRFKMLDNLRRSLIAPAWVAASALGWLTLSGDAAVL